MNGVVDLQEIESISATTDGIKRAIDMAIEFEDRFRGSRWAVISDRDSVFGIARMYELRRNAESYEVRAFREPGPAFKWLGVEQPIDKKPDG
ncbi:MAG: hypothetical protein CL908_06795 [Deltaproteobacteria bacterium]|nr:hypothetical protein [Deltaproteobacteria bacterium]